MENDLVELCPICIESPAENYTECGHCYCVNCLSRIKLCAICRKSLLREKLCKEIKENFEKRSSQNLERDLLTEIDIIVSNIASLLDSDEEYDDFGRRLNQSEDEELEYNPIVSYYGQFPNNVSRLGVNMYWTSRIFESNAQMHERNRIPRFRY